MPQSNQDYTARRFQSFDTEKPPRYDAGYECELPPGVRSELVAPRRPRILGDSKRATLDGPAVKGRLYLLLLALMIGAAAATSWYQWNAERARSRQAISQSLAPQPAPTPDPAVNTWRAQLAGHPEQFPYANAAPRTAPVKLPPPKAQLVRLPEWRVGETRPVTMPYNLEVLATLKGRLDAEWMLPTSGNHIGDTWIVGNTPWLWLVAPGATHADWLDP